MAATEENSLDAAGGAIFTSKESKKKKTALKGFHGGHVSALLPTGFGKSSVKHGNVYGPDGVVAPWAK